MKKHIGSPAHKGRNFCRHVILFCWLTTAITVMTSRSYGDEPWRAMRTGTLALRDVETHAALDMLADRCAIPVHMFAEHHLGRKPIHLEAGEDGTLGEIIDDLLAQFPGSSVCSSEGGVVVTLHARPETDSLFQEVYQDISFEGSFDEFMDAWIIPRRSWNYFPPAGSDKRRVLLRVDGRITRRDLLVKAAESCHRQVRLFVDPVPNGLLVQNLDPSFSIALSETSLEPRGSMSLYLKTYKR